MITQSGYSFFPLGDSAVLLDFGNVIDREINTLVLQIFRHLKQNPIQGIHDIVPAYSSLAIFYDVPTISKHVSIDETVFDLVVSLIQKEISRLIVTEEPQSRRLKIPVCYAERFGLDLKELSAQKNKTIEELIHLHTSKMYIVYMIGFLPGFAYMGELNVGLKADRKQEPRKKVPAGSVGIAGLQTGIYPVDAPGGWQIIGRTPLQLFNASAEQPVLFQPGDEVIFYPITEYEFENFKGRII